MINGKLLQRLLRSAGCETYLDLLSVTGVELIKKKATRKDGWSRKYGCNGKRKTDAVGNDECSGKRRMKTRESTLNREIAKEVLGSSVKKLMDAMRDQTVRMEQS